MRPDVLIRDARRAAGLTQAALAARLGSLLKQSQGKPNRLTPTERAEVRMLVRKLEPIAIARSVVPIGRKAVGRRR